jgi:putative endonuclease
MVVYILYSATIDAYYVGQSENFVTRLDSHLQHAFSRSFTRRAQDWQLALLINCVSRKQAVNIEAHIKRMKSRKYIDNIIRYPEMIEKLLLRYP